MGKQKKTRNVSVKKMISPKDPRLKANVKKNELAAKKRQEKFAAMMDPANDAGSVLVMETRRHTRECDARRRDARARATRDPFPPQTSPDTRKPTPTHVTFQGGVALPAAGSRGPPRVVGGW